MLAMVAGCIVGTLAAVHAFRTHEVEVGYAGSGDAKLNAIWSIVDRKYVDQIEGDSVMDRVYAALLSTLDPHSVYLPREVLDRENESLMGRFEGVGVAIRVIRDSVCAYQVVPGGPSEKAGVLAGDRILSVNGLPLSGVSMTADSAVTLLRGPRKSTAALQIMRPGERKPRQINVVRGVIHTPSIPYSGMIDKTTGYVRIDRFSENTYDEFRTAVTALNEKGMKRLVLDLRDNGGGLMSAAQGICDELLPGREMIVYTEGAHQRREVSRSSNGGLFCRGELIVLLNEFSASASEIVAGAVQDNDRGVVMGRRSFGKGLVQQQFPLSDGSALQLTIARYYTPSGRCIQRPYDKGTDEYYSDFVSRIIDEQTADSLLAAVTDSTPYHTSMGRTVYAGGGIMPDYIIRYKSDENVVYYNKLLNKGIVGDYVFDYVSANGAAIRASYATPEDFLSKYRVDDAMMQQLFERAGKAGIARDDKCISRYREEIRARVKAHIGEMLYSSGLFYAVQLPFDPEVKEALSAAPSLLKTITKN